jgi:hypothetical protein
MIITKSEFQMGRLKSRNLTNYGDVGSSQKVWK